MTKTILLMYSTHQASEEHIARLKEIAKDYEIKIANSEEEAIEIAKEAEIIFGHRYLRQCMPNANNLKWIQTTAGGVDRLPLEEIKSKGVNLTRVTFPSKTIAIHAVTLALALTRKIPEFISSMQQKQWNREIQLPRIPKTAMILGMGNIGKEIGKIMKGLGIKVIGVNKNADDEIKEICEEIFTDDTWKDSLNKTDLCFLALPLNEETRKTFDESTIKALPKHAIMINTARGELIDTEVLIKQLKEGQLGGGALDVLENEPPEESIWETPNLIITPHIAAHYEGRNEQFEKFAEKQLERYIKGEQVENIVDME